MTISGSPDVPISRWPSLPAPDGGVRVGGSRPARIRGGSGHALTLRGSGASSSSSGAGPRPPHRSPPYRWRVLAWRARFALAALLLGTAAALAVAQLRPPSPPTVPVVTAARDLVAGAALTTDDVRVVPVPVATAVAGAHPDVAAVLGRAPVVAVPSGLPIVDSLLGADRLAGSGPPGTVVVPVRLADPGVAALLRPGDRVDLVAATTSGTGDPVSRRLAERAVVLPRPAVEDDRSPPSSGLLGGAPQDDVAGALTLVAVAPEEAAALAGASGWAGISAVLVE
ncbi:RcpC/CpaB family pilus assembly protein [Cellulomonas aerilata]|uniref:SAF domain-containing protein n=1 Tax=Cellulomonas aerilata TaxID=515326 RepID=A0A512DDR9_9CELL|nr:RcpC/CpaB family pilus assembly protein [Cellulomonas aerilata]GEO34605.1 hypothetical protein CAE01nite_23300 [Cellulomonas aerilata]